MANASYAHDAEVIVFNYQTRATETGPLAGFSINGNAADPLATDRLSLREAITSIQVNKTKGQPQGTFSITLKPTQEWTKILVPGSWCNIFMSDQRLTADDIGCVATLDDDDNVLSPLKMVGIIMAVRVQKQRAADGAISLTYTVNGYDFGYVFTSSIYINHVFQADVINGVLKGPLSELSFPKDKETYGNPAENIQRILKAWSIMSSTPDIKFTTGTIETTSPPPIRMELPKDLSDFFGTGKDILQFVNTVIGVDQRDSKVVELGDDGDSPSFDFQLVGEKFFMIWQLIVNNSLWGMINQYLNPILNEAYCDLHPVATTSAIGLTSVSLRPMLVVRQIPFNTPDFDKYWNDALKDNISPPKKYEITNFVDLPRTTLPAEKVMGYDIGYSDYDRINFVEVNGFDIDVSKTSPGAFNNTNKPRFEAGSIKRFGLRTKVIFGADYGGVRSHIDESGFWSPLIMDWWFNGNRYANGTIECIGLAQHIAVGENVVLPDEKILGHIESYSHTFTVDENGNRIFRTNIDFSRGISSDSTNTQFKYIYGETNFGGDGIVSAGPLKIPAHTQDPSIFEDDVQKRASYTELRPGPGTGGVVGGLNAIKGLLK